MSNTTNKVQLQFLSNKEEKEVIVLEKLLFHSNGIPNDEAIIKNQDKCDELRFLYIKRELRKTQLLEVYRN